MSSPEVAAGPVLVLHDDPACRRGIAAGLRQAGFGTVEGPGGHGAAWIACLVPAGPGCGPAEVDRLRADRPQAPVVGLTRDRSVPAARHALRIGADAVVAQDAGAGEIAEVLRGALAGTVVLPLDVVRSLVAGGDGAPGWLDPAGAQATWLRALCRGVPLSRVARAAGYSERQMYRLMQELYERMGVRTRGEAIAMAAGWGLA